MNVTAEDLIEESAPLWLDILLVHLMWSGGFLFTYLGVFRINQSQGKFLIATRAVGLAWCAYAGRLTWWLWTYGDLPLSYWALVPLLVLTSSTVALGIERLRMGRVRYRRRRSDQTESPPNPP